MSIPVLRLIVGVFFLVASAFLALRYWLVPEWAARYDPLRMNVGAVFAFVFGLLNITRWYLSWSHRRTQAIPVRYPLQPDPSLVRPELRPEFDFSTQPPKAEPSEVVIDGPDHTWANPNQASGNPADAGDSSADARVSPESKS